MKTIILVEDDPAIRESFSVIIEKNKYHLVSFKDGITIVKQEVKEPGLFILDKNIAGLDGLDLCEYIKHSAKYRHVPVLLLSANPDIIRMAKAAGADGTIAKPFSVKTTREKIAKYI